MPARAFIDSDLKLFVIVNGQMGRNAREGIY